MQTEPTRRNPNYAVCPRCDYLNNMPPECLRDEWQTLDCGLCRLALEYRGVSCPALGPDTRNGGYEIETRRPEAPAKGYAIPDEATPPGGNASREFGAKVRDIRHRLEHAVERQSPPEASPAIGPGEKLSDSHNRYRRRFEIEGDRLMLLGAASQAGPEALNKFWLDLGRDLGFVWTTVQDLEAVSRSGMEFGVAQCEVVHFTAEVEDVLPPFPAFDDWWRDNRVKLPGARHEIARSAFEAGSRSAVSILSQLDDGVIELVREVERGEDAPSGSLLIVGFTILGGLIGSCGTYAVLAIGGWL